MDALLGPHYREGNPPPPPENQLRFTSDPPPLRPKIGNGPRGVFWPISFYRREISKNVLFKKGAEGSPLWENKGGGAFGPPRSAKKCKFVVPRGGAVECYLWKLLFFPPDDQLKAVPQRVKREGTIFRSQDGKCHPGKIGYKKNPLVALP